MQLVTDRTVEILIDVCAWTFVLTAAGILIALTFDAVEELLERVRRAADRHRSARRLKPTRAWRSQRGAVAVEFGILLPFMLVLILGGALLNLAITDHGRLENACQAGARAGATDRRPSQCRPLPGVSGSGSPSPFLSAWCHVP